jgi:curli biogenesis system outer membrane secretion channel CsgG
MKKTIFTVLLLAFAATVFAPFSYAGGSSDNSGGNSQSTTPAPSTPSAPAPAPAPAAPRSPYFTGDGGTGMSLAVLVPSAQGIAADQNYLPTMVQGVLVGDLTKYSAISVLDRLRLETVLRETESGIYKNEDDFGRLGQIANVDYALTGSIT